MEEKSSHFENIVMMRLDKLVGETLTRRDQFAMAAMCGLASVILSQDDKNINLIGAKKVAECAVEYADALAAALDKKENGE